MGCRGNEDLETLYGDPEFRLSQMQQAIRRLWEIDLGERPPFFPSAENEGERTGGKQS
ncbi:MAG: hypothetical protein KGJ86_18400 [Chloroflexota bacterium]|nr:hypothetical protein [Chloroflexota bacterium]